MDGPRPLAPAAYGASSPPEPLFRAVRYDAIVRALRRGNENDDKSSTASTTTTSTAASKGDVRGSAGIGSRSDSAPSAAAAWSASDECLTRAAVEAGTGMIAAGTDRGAVYVFEPNGSLVTANLDVHKGPILCIAFANGVIASGGADGNVMCYEWLSGRLCNLSSSDSDRFEPVTEICLSVDFGIGSGHCYCARVNGTITRHSRQSVQYGTTDGVIFTDATDAATLLQRVWQGLPADTPHTPSSTNSSPSSILNPHAHRIRCMQYEAPFLAFESQNCVHLYDERLGRVCSRLGRSSDRRGGAGGTGNASPTGVATPLSRGSRSPRGGMSAASSRRSSDVGLSGTVDRPSVGLVLLGDVLIAYWDATIYVCSIWSDRSIEVTASYAAQWPITAMTSVGNHIALAFEDAPSAADPAPVQVALVSLADMCLVDLFSLPANASGRFIGVVSGSILYDAGTTYAGVRRNDSTSPISATGASASSRSGDASAALACFIYGRDVVVLRPLSAPEQVLWLVMTGRFEAATHVTQRMRKTRELAEVANEHACALWELHGKYAEAVQVWAEYVLPYATPQYWSAFVDKMEKADKLPLLERYLPFNDRSLLSPDVYFRLLEHHVRRGMYASLYDCVARWPVVYPLDQTIALVAGEIYRVRLSATRRMAALAPDADDAEEGGHVATASFSVSPLCASDSLALSTQVDLGPLWLAVYKLYDFSGRFLEAAQALLAYRPTAESSSTEPPALEFFNARRLWSVLSIKRHDFPTSIPADEGDAAATVIHTSKEFAASSDLRTSLLRALSRAEPGRCAALCLGAVREGLITVTDINIILDALPGEGAADSLAVFASAFRAGAQL